jgi:microcystin-dependent protein
MATPYLSEIKICSFGFAPKGWAFCNGQLLPINQNQALFSLIGTTYGGDGIETFQLPNLQGCVPVHMGNDPIGVPYALGHAGGHAEVTLTTAEMPAHSHPAQGDSTVASSSSPAGNVWADSASKPYSPNPDTVMDAGIVSQEGAGEPHNNMPPYLVLNFVIAIAGIFPSEN